MYLSFIVMAKFHLTNLSFSRAFAPASKTELLPTQTCAAKAGAHLSPKLQDGRRDRSFLS
jgi:hypothetical protein